MNATLHFQRGPYFALLAVLFLALMLALAPGLSEFDISGLAEGGSGSGPAVEASGGNDLRGTPTWVRDPLEPPLAGMESSEAAR